MLKDDFYKIISQSQQDDQLKVVTALNVKHKIFEGHFPGQPVLPGACILHMLKEISEENLSKKLQLFIARQVKFLSVIDPQQDNICEFEIDYKQEENGMLNVSAKLLQKTIACFKFSGIFKS